MRWRGWGLVLAVLAAIGGLAAAGRFLELPEEEQPPASTATTGLVSVATLPPAAAVPEALRRPLRLPGLRGDGSCPTSLVAGPPMTAVHPVAAVAVGDGPVYPVLFRADTDGRLDRSAVAYWDAPGPLDGVVIVRGHRLGAPRDQIRFREDDQLRPTHVLDPAVAYPDGAQGRWWRPTRLRAGAGCYGLQIDGASFSQILVVEFG